MSDDPTSAARCACARTSTREGELRTPDGAASRALARRLLQLLRNEVGYRDARHVRRFFCFSCDKRTLLEHVHTEAFVRRSRA